MYLDRASGEILYVYCSVRLKKALVINVKGVEADTVASWQTKLSAPIPAYLSILVQLSANISFRLFIFLCPLLTLLAHISNNFHSPFLTV